MHISCTVINLAFSFKNINQILSRPISSAYARTKQFRHRSFNSTLIYFIGGFRGVMPPRCQKSPFATTVSTKMPRRYGISTLKNPKNLWGGGHLPRPLPLWGGGQLRRIASSRAPSALDLPHPNCNTWIRLWFISSQVRVSTIRFIWFKNKVNCVFFDRVDVPIKGRAEARAEDYSQRE